MKKLLKLPQFKGSNLLYVFTCIACSVMFMAANTSKFEFTPYQMLMFEIKANEGYRSWWYADGHVQGRPAHSIGFGWNDCGNRRRNEISKYTRDGKVTFSEAMEITLKEISKYGRLNSDPYKNLALQLYSYNCGLTNDGRRLGRCCGAKWGCGSGKKNVRKMHNRRRRFELALWNHDLNLMRMHTQANLGKLQTYIPMLKARGEYQ